MRYSSRSRGRQISSRVAPVAGITVGGLALVGVGAGLAYMFDRDRGRARRAYARDKMMSVLNDSGELMSKMGRHMANHLRGTVAEGRSRLRHEDVSDEQVIQRIRSQIGRAGSSARKIDVVCVNGEATLSGKLADQGIIDRVLQIARGIRGVRNVRSQIAIGQM